MRVALYTSSVSPHQLPLARELVTHFGADNYRYIYTEQQGLSAERQKLGWVIENTPWLMAATNQKAQDWLENSEVLICSFRDTALIERRCRKNLKTFYTNERWFKPPIGWLRMLVPSFRRVIRRMVALCRQYDCFRMLPIGIHAYNDYKWAGVPESKMTLWGYFVAPSKLPPHPPFTSASKRALRVLWVGRMLKLKNVDVIIRAFQDLNPTYFELTLVGDGPERERLIKMAQGQSNVFFRDPVPIDKVRELMREHDVFVFPSNGYEGWGAVVSEALEEGMLVLGSNQSGSCATILPLSHRFNCSDIKHLTKLLLSVHDGEVNRIEIGDWSACAAMNRFLSEVGYE